MREVIMDLLLVGTLLVAYALVDAIDRIAP